MDEQKSLFVPAIAKLFWLCYFVRKLAREVPETNQR